MAFSSGSKLKRIEITGGAPLTLADVELSPVSPTGTWNRDGVILFGGSGGCVESRRPAAAPLI